VLGGRYKSAAQDPAVRLAQLPVDVTRSVHHARLAAARAAKDAAEADSGSLTSEETVKAAPAAGCTIKVQADVETAPRSDADAPVGASSGYFSF
jgi:heterodisulfide reductase subunit A-like polyferredoxin